MSQVNCHLAIALPGGYALGRLTALGGGLAGGRAPPPRLRMLCPPPPHERQHLTRAPANQLPNKCGQSASGLDFW